MANSDFINFLSNLDYQIASLNSGAGLLLDQLSFDQRDTEAVERAVSRLFFIAESLRDVGARMEALSGTAAAVAFRGEA